MPPVTDTLHFLGENEWYNFTPNDDVHFVLDKPDKLDFYCATNNSSRVDVWLYLDIFSWFLANQH